MKMQYKKFPPLYRKGKKDRILFWQAEVLGHKYRAKSGIHGGTVKTAEWVEAETTNAGRANERDPFAQAVAEVEAKMAKMQKSGGYVDSLEEVAFAKPKFNVPMTAHGYEPGKTKLPPMFYTQGKFNGFRTQTDEDRMTTRRGENIHTCFHIKQALIAAFRKYPGLVVDGEAYNHAYRELLNRIGSLLRKQTPTVEEIAEASKVVELYVYDAYIKGKESMPFSERLKLVKDIVKLADDPCIKLVETRVSSARDLPAQYKADLKEGYEGTMIRFPDAPYEHDRSHALLKYKPRVDSEFTIIEGQEGVGKRKGVLAKLVCRLPRPVPGGPKTFTANVKWTDEEKKKWWDIRHKLPGKQATVSYAYLTEFGVPFHNYLEKIWLEPKI